MAIRIYHEVSETAYVRHEQLEQIHPYNIIGVFFGNGAIYGSGESPD